MYSIMVKLIGLDKVLVPFLKNLDSWQDNLAKIFQFSFFFITILIKGLSTLQEAEDYFQRHKVSFSSSSEVLFALIMLNETGNQHQNQCFLTW